MLVECCECARTQKKKKEQNNNKYGWRLVGTDWYCTECSTPDRYPDFPFPIEFIVPDSFKNQIKRIK